MAPDLGGALRTAVAALSPVTLAQLDQAQLHDREESKVILRTADVPEALDRLAEEYVVLDHVNASIGEGDGPSGFDRPDVPRPLDRLQLRHPILVPLNEF